MVKLNFLVFARNSAIACFISWLILFPVPGENINQPQQSIQTIYTTTRGGDQKYEVGRSVDKKVFREMLARHFPDWEARLSMEKRQAIIYNKAEKKLKEYQKLSPLLKNHEKWLTDEEKFAIDYFRGRGIYEKYQDPKIPPNLFDTRKTFLKKMEDQ